MRNCFRIGLFIALLCAAPPPVWGAGHFCARTVDRTLEKLGISAGDVETIDYGSETSSGEGAELIAVRAWVMLKSCTGSLVVDMTPDCDVVQTYTRHQCKVPGVRQY